MSPRTALIDGRPGIAVWQALRSRLVYLFGKSPTAAAATKNETVGRLGVLAAQDTTSLDVGIDVGISDLNQCVKKFGVANFSDFAKPPLSLQELLKYKYLLSVGTRFCWTCEVALKHAANERFDVGMSRNDRASRATG